MADALLFGGFILFLGLVIGFPFELLLTWASAILVDADPKFWRLCLFVVVAMGLTVGLYLVGSMLLGDVNKEWIAAATAEGKSPWSLYALHNGIFMVASLLVITALAAPVLGLSPKQSLLVGVFVVLLRVLLWSLILGIVFAVVGFLQGWRGNAPKGTEQRTAQVVLVAPGRA